MDVIINWIQTSRGYTKTTCALCGRTFYTVYGKNIVRYYCSDGCMFSDLDRFKEEYKKAIKKVV